MKLSGVVITHNEEKNIERCLKSLHFCDEIIVVDSKSSDHTRDIASKLATRVEVRDWKGYVDQKNFAGGLATNDWILSIDADEEVTPELKKEILTSFSTSGGNRFSAFSIPRKTMHFGRWIRHGGWYPNRLVRLFDKKKGAWVGTELHERWETTGEVASFEHHLLHYSFEDLADQVSRNNRYSSLGALALFQKGRRFSCLKLYVKTAYKFIETYFIKLGLLDGYPGLIISVSAAYSVFLKWAKLWELENGEKKG